MFSNKTQLLRRTPENGIDRENYLSLLVDEYINTSSFDAKIQVLANLANFAYDPINYTYIRNVGVLDIFIHVLKNETNSILLHFAAAGICNLCIDPLKISRKKRAFILLRRVYLKRMKIQAIFKYHEEYVKEFLKLNFEELTICHYARQFVKDPENIDYMLENNTLSHLQKLLKSEHIETVADIITIYIYLYNSHAKNKINIIEISSEMKTLKMSTNPMIINLASIFLDEIASI